MIGCSDEEYYDLEAFVGLRRRVLAPTSAGQVGLQRRSASRAISRPPTPWRTSRRWLRTTSA
eukprot:2572517-Prymnesium_polylepis.1